LVVAQSSSEIPEGLMNNPVYAFFDKMQSHYLLGKLPICLCQIDLFDVLLNVDKV